MGARSGRRMITAGEIRKAENVFLLDPDGDYHTASLVSHQDSLRGSGHSTGCICRCTLKVKTCGTVSCVQVRSEVPESSRQALVGTSSLRFAACCASHASTSVVLKCLASHCPDLSPSIAKYLSPIICRISSRILGMEFCNSRTRTSPWWAHRSPKCGRTFLFDKSLLARKHKTTMRNQVRKNREQLRSLSWRRSGEEERRGQREAL